MLQIAFRRLRRNRPAISALQIAGLAFGMAGFLLVAQFVFFERSFDRAIPERERLFRLGANIYREGALHLRSAMSYLDLGPSLQADFPADIEAVARLVILGGQLRAGDENFLEDRLCYTDETFPALFGLEMLRGDAGSALAEPGAALLSESAARQFFGTTECLGRTLEFESQFPQKLYTVRGICRDMPPNSHFRSRVFLSLKSLTQTPGVLEGWAWRDFVNYLQLKPGADPAAFSQKINRTDYVGTHWPRYPERLIRHELFLQNVPDIHLAPRLDAEFGAVGNGKTVSNLSLLGLFLLVVSVLNFVLLSLAKSADRAKEIGIRKTVGAGKGRLVGQFFAENLPVFAVSAVLAGLLVWAAQPFFRDLTGAEIGFEFLKNPALAALVAGGFVGLLLLANLAPAWAMSRLAPAGLIRPASSAGATGGLSRARGALVVFQFSLAIFMMLSTLVVWQQIRFLLHRDTGLRLDQTLVLRFHNDRSPEMAAKISALKTRLLAEMPGGSSQVSSSMSVPGDGNPWVPSIRKLSENGLGAGASRVISLNAVDADFIPNYGLKILAGRNFDPARYPEHDALVLTETAARALGYARPEDALRERYICAGDTVRVVGVVSEYSESGGQRLPPEAMFVQRTDEARRLSVRLAAGADLPAAIESMRRIWQEVFAGAVFDFVFLDQHFARQFDAEMRFGKITGLFASLAILIACMGLLGIATLAIAKRTKEIGIRKVLGASIAGITGLLAKDFLKLVLIAIVIASPIAYYFMQNWLADFAYRIDLQWWMFAGAGVLAVAIAFLTVGFQSVRAALANPVKSLRSE
jgi:putative ABC transport system permease protein